MKIVASYSEPKVAVFWYIPNKDKFIGEDCPISECVFYGDFGQVDADHFLIWDSYCDAYHLPNVEYDYYPRGRVLFNSKLHKPVVVCDRYILNNEQIKKNLCYEYNLNKDAVIWESDDHYISHYSNK